MVVTLRRRLKWPSWIVCTDGQCSELDKLVGTLMCGHLGATDRAGGALRVRAGEKPAPEGW